MSETWEARKKKESHGAIECPNCRRMKRMQIFTAIENDGTCACRVCKTTLQHSADMVREMTKRLTVAKALGKPTQ